ncbi:MAG: efflux RND transporter periplasmic adaptor subunit [Acidobacteriaceae bacterium]
MKTIVMLLTLAMTMNLAQAAMAAPAGNEASVLVETEALRSQTMSETLTVYGAVIPAIGATENMSFPRPVQIARLLVAPGQVVNHGEPLLELSTEANAAAVYHQAESTEIFARGELKRMDDLAAQQLATQSQIAAARKALQDAQALLAAQQKLGSGLNNQTVKAPFDALVTAISVQQGDRIQPGTAVMQLAKSGALRVLMGVEPEDASRVRIGMPMRLTSVFGNGKTVDAKVSQVFGAINPQTRLVDVAAQLAGPTNGLLPGMQVRGLIDLGGRKYWVVSRSAVLQDGGGAYLFQVQGEHAKRVDVTVEVESGDTVAVTGSLDSHLKVVVLGNYELRDGMVLREKTQ